MGEGLWEASSTYPANINPSTPPASPESTTNKQQMEREANLDPSSYASHNCLPGRHAQKSSGGTGTGLCDTLVSQGIVDYRSWR